MREIIVGLCKGRHQLPVDNFIFNDEISPLDFDGMEDIVNRWYYGLCHQAGEYIHVTLYVTGLSAALASVIKVLSSVNLGKAKVECMSGQERGRIFLTLMHYDRDTESYKPQIIWQPLP